MLKSVKSLTKFLVPIALINSSVFAQTGFFVGGSLNIQQNAYSIDKKAKKPGEVSAVNTKSANFDSYRKSLLSLKEEVVSKLAAKNLEIENKQLEYTEKALSAVKKDMRIHSLSTHHPAEYLISGGLMKDIKKAIKIENGKIIFDEPVTFSDSKQKTYHNSKSYDPESKVLESILEEKTLAEINKTNNIKIIQIIAIEENKSKITFSQESRFSFQHKNKLIEDSVPAVKVEVDIPDETNYKKRLDKLEQLQSNPIQDQDTIDEIKNLQKNILQSFAYDLESSIKHAFYKDLKRKEIEDDSSNAFKNVKEEANTILNLKQESASISGDLSKINNKITIHDENIQMANLYVTEFEKAITKANDLSKQYEQAEKENNLKKQEDILLEQQIFLSNIPRLLNDLERFTNDINKTRGDIDIEAFQTAIKSFKAVDLEGTLDSQLKTIKGKIESENKKLKEEKERTEEEERERKEKDEIRIKQEKEEERKNKQEQDMAESTRLFKADLARQERERQEEIASVKNSASKISPSFSLLAGYGIKHNNFGFITEAGVDLNFATEVGDNSKKELRVENLYNLYLTQKVGYYFGKDNLTYITGGLSIKDTKVAYNRGRINMREEKKITPNLILGIGYQRTLTRNWAMFTEFNHIVSLSKVKTKVGDVKTRSEQVRIGARYYF